MSDITINLNPALYQYLQKYSLREGEIFKKLREKTHKMSMSQMQISPEQGQFMQLLMRLMGARKTLDIGVFTGYSTLSVAVALPEDGKVIGCDTNVEWTKMAKQYWEMAGVSHKIDLRLAPAVETLDLLIKNGEAGTFDFAFIDANKANYAIYYEQSLQLLRIGGLIMVDNVLWDGKVADLDVQDDNTKTIRAFNEKLHNDPRIMLSMLPVGDGITLALKVFS
ncbi:MAG TPA: class I SAM-dependent methyltransferase [Gammaproteobacteria bacterium]|jgi:predicted O-methyltransferase YrrM|nr:class I SAM-dependent methyltransferase [Gammaproteobacteria bacterium]